MDNDRNDPDWQLGFRSALAGWAQIPPAGTNARRWQAGWRQGRACARERERHCGHRTQAA